MYNFAPKLLVSIMALFKIISLNIFLLIACTLPAQDGIFEKLAAVDSTTNATVKIHQDKRIEKLVSEKKATHVSTMQSTANGFRVQVFSSNMQRTAKSDAFKIEKQIKEAFPNTGVYVTYNSPFWKVRVGDFTNTAAAHAFMGQLIEAFPQLRATAYTVKEQIFVN